MPVFFENLRPFWENKLLHKYCFQLFIIIIRWYKGTTLITMEKIVDLGGFLRIPGVYDCTCAVRGSFFSLVESEW
jgi:hypothetical protein